ncbi:MAG: nitroreductase [Rhizomicrobium sp.]
MTDTAHSNHIECIQKIIRGRASVRAFRPDPVPDHIIREIFELAQWSPSNCNTQPWTVYVLGGAIRKRLTDTLIAAAVDGHKPDIPYNLHFYPSHFKKRQLDHVICQYKALGISREDKTARLEWMRANLSSFGAPHVALLYMPRFGNAREAGDIGIYAQTLMLALSAYGLGSCAQTMLGLFAVPIREMLNIPNDLKLMFGIAFGYEDKTSTASRLTQSRAPLDISVKMLGC